MTKVNANICEFRDVNFHLDDVRSETYALNNAGNLRNLNSFGTKAVQTIVVCIE